MVPPCESPRNAHWACHQALRLALPQVGVLRLFQPLYEQAPIEVGMRLDLARMYDRFDILFFLRLRLCHHQGMWSFWRCWVDLCYPDDTSDWLKAIIPAGLLLGLTSNSAMYINRRVEQKATQSYWSGLLAKGHNQLNQYTTLIPVKVRLFDRLIFHAMEVDMANRLRGCSKVGSTVPRAGAAVCQARQRVSPSPVMTFSLMISTCIYL